MSIQKMHGSATATLLSAGLVPVPLSEPPCALSLLEFAMPAGTKAESGLWECSPGRFRRQVSRGEVMHFLSGEGSFTPDGGEPPVEFKAGDTVVFPPETHGVWDIGTTVRKVYVVL